MSCLLFFSLWRCKKSAHVSYIYIYIHAHTHSRADLTVYFSRARASEGGTPPQNPPAPFTRSQSCSDLLAIARPFCSSKPYHKPLHFSISISCNSDARGFVTWRLRLLSWGRKTPSLISCKPSALGLELRPHTHYVVYYLNTNALALALGTHRYHGKQEKHTCSGRM